MRTVKGFIDPESLARDHATFSGVFKCADLERFAALIHRPIGEVRYQLRFSRDRHGRPMVHGGLSADTTLICQRCLEPMDIVLAAAVGLVGIQGDDQGKDLDGELEPLLLADEGVCLLTLIENELLLALPAAPTHDTGSGCEVPRQYRVPAAGPRRKPLADLALLKEQMK